VAILAERRHRGRKQQRLCHRHHLGLVSLLLRLVPERGEIGRHHHAGDDLRIGVAERGNLRAEIVGVPEVDELVSFIESSQRGVVK